MEQLQPTVQLSVRPCRPTFQIGFTHLARPVALRVKSGFSLGRSTHQENGHIDVYAPSLKLPTRQIWKMCFVFISYE